MKIKLSHTFKDIVSVENILEAWKEFVKGKRHKKDVQEFSFCLMDNIIALHRELANLTYQHGGYKAFNISDPKPRNIHKASVRDRLLHHALYRKLYPFFDKTFIADSFSCRLNKGTHKAINRFRAFTHKVSKNNTKTEWALKCDIRKFFENISHSILIEILKQYIPDKNIIWLLERVIRSFFSKPNTGLPLGNLTSQLFVNIYMNQFDQFVKHRLKIKYYLRYADDFVILSANKGWLENQIKLIRDFLHENLKLDLHPDKIFIKTLASGVNFLGWVHFPDHRVLRTTTKRRMFRRVRQSVKGLEQNQNSLEFFSQNLQSYLGMLRHGNSHKIKQKLYVSYLVLI